MKKQLLLIALSLLSYGAFATHMLGGELTWEKTANGQFIFELRLYKDCGAGTAGFGPTQTITGPNGTITLSLVSQLDISPTCIGVGQVSCGSSSSGMGAVEMHTFRNTVPVTLQGTPPATGWDFVHMTCCRPASIINMAGAGSSQYYIKSTMYPGASASSPYFTVTPTQILTPGNNTYSVHAESADPQDSVYHTLVGARVSASAIGNYVSGFSGASPFPSSSSNAANGSLSIDGNSGLVSYDIQTATNGLYVISVDVEQWRNGVLIGKVNREFSVIYYSPSWSNDAPSTAIDTAIYPQVDQVSEYAYKAFVTAGDTLNFVINATDFDTDPITFLAQNIGFNAQGKSIDTSYSLTGMTGGATLSPVAPQSGYIQASSNQIEFSWIIDNSHAINPYHHFVFSMSDNQCPFPGITNLSLLVVVQKSLNISNDTIQACAGDSVQLSGYSRSGNYQWSPAAAFIDPTIANPEILPPGSGYYYLTDPTTNEKDSVYVKLTQPAMFDLDTNSHQLELTDLNGTTNRIWYYNGVPFYYPHDTLTPFGYGDYWVKSAVGACLLISDTIHIAYGSSYSVFDPNNGGYSGADSAILGSLGMTFQINQSATLNSVTLVGVEDLYKSGTGYDLNLKIYDANQTEVFSKDITLTPPFYGPQDIEVGYSLVGNVDYTIAMTGDTALSFKLYENVSYPSTPHFNGITVSGSYEGAAKQFPTQPSNYLLPITLNTDANVVGLEESMSSAISVYPNPANDLITLSGFETEGQVQLLDIQGRLLRSYRVSSESLMIKRGGLSSGVYFLNISVGNNTEVRKVILK